MGLLKGISALVLDNAAEGIILCDENLNCVFWNKSIERFTGIDNSYSVGKPIDEILACLNLQSLAPIFHSAASGTTAEFEIAFKKHDNSEVWLKVKVDRLAVEQVTYIIGYFCDITEQKRLEEKLFYSQKQSEEFFYKNPNPMWIYDLETFQFLAVNSAAVAHYGYSEEEFLSMTIRDIQPMREDFYLMDNKIARTTDGTAEHIVRRHKKKDGSIILVEITARAFNFKGRRAEVALLRDITEQIREHNALMISEELFRLVWEHSPVGFRLADENGLIVRVNKAFCDIVGKPRAELEGKPISSIYASEIADRIQQTFIQRFKERNFSHRINDEYKLWNGRKAYFEVFNSFFETEGDVPLLLSIFTDFTEARRAIELLALSEAKYRTLAENISDVICIIKQDLTITDISLSARKFLGYTENELIGKSFEKTLSPNSVIEFKNKLHEFSSCELQVSNSKTIELEFVRKDKSSVWAEVRFNQIHIPGEKEPRILCAMRDITERRRVHAIMRLQAAAIESAGNAVIITTTDGLIVWANQAFTQLTGYELEEVIGKKPSILKSGRHTSQFYKQMWETICSGRVWRGEITNRRKDGSLYVEDMTITPVFDEIHHITHFVAIKSDITKRKELEQELKVLHKRFELIFNSSPAGIAIVTLRDCRFIEVNPSFLELTKFNKDKIIGYTAEELQLFEKNEDCLKAIEKLRAGVSTRNHDINIKTRTGELRNVSVSAERVKLGIEDCAILIFNDITEKKSLEEQLRHSQRLESIGTLAGGVAHDFNNILTVIQGHTSLLMMNPLTPPELQDSINQIADAAERAAGLTRQLLAFSRKQKLESKVININTVIENLTKMLKRLIGEHITLECLIKPDIPTILADIGMMEQMIMNLVVNARDAMPKGGRLTISTSSKFIPAQQLPKRQDLKQGEYIIISVKDTGCGIKPEDLPKIFEPFFTTKGQGKGTGLGLAMVQNIVYQHKGWIEVQSQLNVGTEFTIYLPAVQHSDTLKQEDSHRWKKAAGETILFVEDEEKTREMTKAVLEQCGFNVLTAHDAIQALELWRKNKDRISLLLTDIVLPKGISGRQLAAQLCTEKPTLKVVITSAYTPDLSQIEFADLKHWQFLLKPYMPTALVNIIRQNLDIKSNHIA
ncbi:MAG: PAS domain-containing hybrid sensor histidine kinase/response regulator [Verrucomicrobiia bacterium]